MSVLQRITLKTLKQNKVRTIVTIVGVIISTAMIMAVATFVTSFQAMLLDDVKISNGEWQATVYDNSYNDIINIKKKSEIDRIAAIQNVGYARLPKGSFRNIPFLYIGGFSDEAYDLISVNLTQGRLPQNSNEIVLRDTMYTDDNGKLELGDEYTISVGDILDENGKPQKLTGFTDKNSKLSTNFVKTYTIVGFYDEFGFEGTQSLGLTAITKLDSENLDNYTYQAVFTLKNPRNIFDYCDSNFSETNYNYELLRYMGITEDQRTNAMIYGLAAILIGIIVLGSVSLIYNSFSISVSDRTKQLGLLSSIGATNKQIRASIFFEGVVISCIGIPLGIISGILGAGVTLKFVGDLLNNGVLNTQAQLGLKVSIGGILVSIIVAFITVMLSALRPAIRAGKITPIQAIRQTEDIKLPKRLGKNRKYSLTKKLFGVQGVISAKNFKRNKKKYRATVVSLVLSVILFVSASAFTEYLVLGMSFSGVDLDYDILYSTFVEDEKADVIFNEFKNVDAVTNSANAIIVNEIVEIDSSRLLKPIEAGVHTEFVFIDDSEFNKLLKGYDKQSDKYYSDELVALGYDNRYIKNANGRYEQVQIIADHSTSLDVEFEQEKKQTIRIEKFIDKLPFGANSGSSADLVLVMPKSAFKRDCFNSASINMFFKTSDYKASTQQMNKILKEKHNYNESVISVDEMLKSVRALVTAIRIFAYGFIVLISLIAIANVFNAISTSVLLRTREFAMLRSVGMNNKGLNKIMCLECLAYGAKSLLYGLPISVGVTYLIYKAVTQGIELPFVLPYKFMLISVLCVFFVVFISMLYAMRKIKKQNVLEALKDDNI